MKMDVVLAGVSLRGVGRLVRAGGSTGRVVARLLGGRSTTITAVTRRVHGPVAILCSSVRLVDSLCTRATGNSYI